jgi:ABC-2 type transport system ATP-binding protein
MIIARGLTKQFTSFKKKPGLKGAIESLWKREAILKKAVDGFDLEIKRGEIVGLLGPNGAGKTTLMKMFTGIIVPSHGELEVLGHQPFNRHKDFRQKIALVMGQKSQLWWDIPAMDSLHLIKAYYEISDVAFKQRVDEMAQLLGVTELLHIHVRRLSLGERMKLELMASLLHQPEILFLDEPTIGLDLVAQDAIRKFIKRYHHNYQPTVILTSHYMQDVQALCSRLVLVMDGKKGFDGPIQRFEQILGTDKSVQFTFAGPITDKSFFEEFNPKWDEQGLCVEIAISQEKLRELSRDVLQRFDVVDFQTDKMPIERVMKELMLRPELLRGQ